MKKFLFLLLLTPFLIAKDDLATDLKKSLISPCCWSGTVYDLDHNPDMEKQIENFVAQGKTKSEILDYYVGVYGERILAIPIATGFNKMAWIPPIGAGFLSLGFLFLYLKTSKESHLAKPTETHTENIPFDDEIEKELKELDE